MARKVNLCLRNFFIFNSNLNHREGEEEKKILFYHPNEIDVDTKVKDVGLSEAIIKFTGTFTNDDNCQAMHTQKTSQLFYQPERGFWMIMTLNVPSDMKMKEGNESIEYRGGDIHDKIYRSVLRHAYQMFRLFAGTFQMNFTGSDEKEKIQNLMTKLDLFYSKFLLALHLPSCDILDVIGSIQYLPLPKFLFLRIHNFISMIKATFPIIKNCIFLYNEQLVWSEINLTDLYSIYEYLIGTLFPKSMETELQGGSIRRSYSIDRSQHGTFITGPESFENCAKVPKVFICNSGACSSYYLVVYKALSATICLFLDDTTSINEEFYQEIHSFMGPQLTSIASEIGESFAKSSPTNSSRNETDNSNPKFLFVNELNLTHSGTIYLDHRRPKNSLIPPVIMNLLADLYNEEKLDNKGISEETVVKAFNDYWIVKKGSNWRQFYVIIHNNKATLLDITNEAKKVLDQHISNVFFEK